MTAETTNLVTLWVWLFKWPVWLAWELWLIRRRKETTSVKLLSQVARRRAWQLTSVVYLDAGLLSHFVWNTTTREGTWLTGLAFWLVAVACLVTDVLTWRTPPAEYAPWQRWARWPLLWAAVGVLAGHLLFPQTGPMPWAWEGFSW